MFFFNIFDNYCSMNLAVTPVSNGLEAWKILENLPNNVDLVLTEVVMPGLTGIGLLCKIMNHKTFKNIPVISEYYSCFVYYAERNFLYCHLILLITCSDVI